MAFETTKFPYIPAHKQKRYEHGKRPVRLIIMHDMEAPETDKTAENVAAYFARPTTEASAHLCVDNNSVIQCVLDNNIAAAAPGTNTDGIHIEMAGYAKQTEADWLDEYGVKLLANAANAAAEYCLKFNIPPIHLTVDELKAGERGIIGHYQASIAYPPNRGHNDPGPGFPWAYFMQKVQQQVAELKLEHGI